MPTISSQNFSTEPSNFRRVHLQSRILACEASDTLQHPASQTNKACNAYVHLTPSRTSTGSCWGSISGETLLHYLLIFPIRIPIIILDTLSPCQGAVVFSRDNFVARHVCHQVLSLRFSSEARRTSSREVVIFLRILLPPSVLWCINSVHGCCPASSFLDPICRCVPVSLILSTQVLAHFSWKGHSLAIHFLVQKSESETLLRMLVKFRRSLWQFQKTRWPGGHMSLRPQMKKYLAEPKAVKQNNSPISV